MLFVLNQLSISVFFVSLLLSYFISILQLLKLLVANRSEIVARMDLHLNSPNRSNHAKQIDYVSLFKADEAYLVGKGKGPVAAYLERFRLFL